MLPACLCEVYGLKTNKLRRRAHCFNGSHKGNLAVSSKCYSYASYALLLEGYAKKTFRHGLALETPSTSLSFHIRLYLTSLVYVRYAYCILLMSIGMIGYSLRISVCIAAIGDILKLNKLYACKIIELLAATTR